VTGDKKESLYQPSSTPVRFGFFYNLAECKKPPFLFPPHPLVLGITLDPAVTIWPRPILLFTPLFFFVILPMAANTDFPFSTFFPTPSPVSPHTSDYFYPPPVSHLSNNTFTTNTIAFPYLLLLLTFSLPWHWFDRRMPAQTSCAHAKFLSSPTMIFILFLRSSFLFCPQPHLPFP